MNKIFWKYVPGVKVTVKWPRGLLTVDDDHPSWDWTYGAKYQTFSTADPNDWYRPWMEKHVGKQGWAWDWKLEADNASEDRLTIKLRKDKSHHSSYITLMWS